MKLLIVDDSVMMREAIATAYKGSVFTEIETAADGLLAVKAFKSFEPDVVTLDITMPHMDGLAAMSEILEHDSSASILIVSALADSHTAIQALKRGAHQFVCKPFDTNDLKEALNDLIKDKKPKECNSSPGSGRMKLKNTMAHSHKLISSESKPLRKVPPSAPIAESVLPSAQQYPSGFVTPPLMVDESSNDTEATRKMKSFKSTYSQMQTASQQ